MFLSGSHTSQCQRNTFDCFIIAGLEAVEIRVEDERRAALELQEFMSLFALISTD